MHIEVVVPSGDTETWDDVLDAVPEDGNLLILSKSEQGSTQNTITRADGARLQIAGIYAAGAWVKVDFGVPDVS